MMKVRDAIFFMLVAAAMGAICSFMIWASPDKGGTVVPKKGTETCKLPPLRDGECRMRCTMTCKPPNVKQLKKGDMAI